GRTEHIHVKVRPPNGSILTTQLYFPGVAANERDSIFDPALLADVQNTAQGKVATFNFVVNP
ncbi:MAG TPA: dioxygenase, partial [Anaerolineae bacterium]|nr:dioxygenase [Anaerolineae bacterium]